MHMTLMSHRQDIPPRHKVISRYRASGTHLAISFIVGITSFLSFWFIWYPAPLFAIMGGMGMYGIVFLVDVGLGPLLTLVVWKQGKRGMKFDMTFIIVAQIIALSYGVHVLWAGRPVFIAAVSGDRFDVVAANEVDQQDLDASHRSLPIWGPEWVSTHAPTDIALKNRVVSGALAGKDYGHFPQLHIPLGPDLKNLYQKARTIEELQTFNKADDKKAIMSWVNRQGVDPQKLKYLPLHARERDAAVFIDGANYRIVGVAVFTPW